MLMIKKILLISLLVFSQSSLAQNQNVFEHAVDKPLDQVYSRLYQAMENDGFYVVFEANIGKNIARFAKKWGDNYNRNRLDGIRSMVFCNGWYANAVSNADPTMLALCPLRLSLIEKAGTTRVLFARPTVIAGDSPASGILLRIENEVIAVIKKALAEV